MPELQRVAVIVLSMSCSSSATERNWKKFDWIHSKRRNRLTWDHVNKLVKLNDCDLEYLRTAAPGTEEEYWPWAKDGELGGEEEE